MAASDDNSRVGPKSFALADPSIDDGYLREAVRGQPDDIRNEAALCETFATAGSTRRSISSTSQPSSLAMAEKISITSGSYTPKKTTLLSGGNRSKTRLNFAYLSLDPGCRGKLRRGSLDGGRIPYRMFDLILVGYITYSY